MKSVCLVSLPSTFLIDDRVFPPLGLLYVAKALNNSGIQDIYVHDGSIKDIPIGYDVYGIGAVTPQFPQAKIALQHIKQSNHRKVQVIIGGPHPTVDPESCIEAGFDNAIVGPGENAILIAMKNGKKIVEAPIFDEVHPDRKKIDLLSYKYTIDGELATSIMTSRGCSYACAFCCKSTRKVKIFSADFVLEELKWLRSYYGYRAFMFFDDIFILHKQRLLTILDEIKKWNIIWRCFVRGDVVVKHGKETIKRMAETGCREVGIGVESGNDSILKIINKGEKLETIKQAINILKECGIRVKGFFIVGLPSESWDTIANTEKFIQSSNLDDIDFTIFQPYKKSAIYENKELYDINWNHLDLEKAWYKGSPENYESQVWTKALSREDIVKARITLERKYKKWI